MESSTVVADSWPIVDSSAAHVVGTRRGEAMTLRTIGLVHRAESAYERAADFCAQARAIFHDIGDQLLEAYSVRALAKAQFRSGDTVGTWQPP
jgi:hypothetical protein